MGAARVALPAGGGQPGARLVPAGSGRRVSTPCPELVRSTGLQGTISRCGSGAAAGAARRGAALWAGPCCARVGRNCARTRRSSPLTPREPFRRAPYTALSGDRYMSVDVMEPAMPKARAALGAMAAGWPEGAGGWGRYTRRNWYTRATLTPQLGAPLGSFDACKWLLTGLDTARAWLRCHRAAERAGRAGQRNLAR